MQVLSDYVNAHRKLLIALVGYVVVFFVSDTKTADFIVGGVDLALLLFVSNDQAAVERVYGRRR